MTNIDYEKYVYWKKQLKNAEGEYKKLCIKQIANSRSEAV